MTGIRRMRHLPFTVLLAAGLPSLLMAGSGGTPDTALNPDQVRWNQVSLEARKLFISAQTVAEWSLVDQTAIAERLIAAPETGGILPGPTVLTLKVAAALPGIRSSTTLWMDPATANSLQYEIRDSGRRLRERTVRFTTTGAFHRTRRPGKSDDEAVPATWTDNSSGFWPYAQRVDGAPVLDALALLYAIAASDLKQPGDRLELLVFQGRELVRVALTVDRLSDTEVAYRATGRDGARTCRGTTRALRIRLAVLPFGDAQPNLDFLGLKSDIVILVEPTVRLPLRIEGRASVIGRVTSSLKEARLRGRVNCPSTDPSTG